jgi:GT2 family glycosyltransferase
MDQRSVQPSSAGAAAPAVGDLRVGVVVATLGRAAECEDLLACLRGQSLPAAAVVISAESSADLPAHVPEDVDVILGPRGLCAQRNRGIQAIADRCDVIVFFDDDFLPTARSLAGLARLFADHPDVVGATGLVLADGVTHGGIALDEAKAVLAKADAAPPEPVLIEQDIRTAYGCNMAFRVSAMAGLKFDERLPLYGWQEDVDFAGQITRVGRVVRTNAFGGVHRGVTKGRTPGVRLGFSQIVNPIYLARKGTMRWSHASTLMLCNLIANHAKALRPEPHIDRLGRLRGNWTGVAHILGGKLDPMAIFDIK